MVQPSGMPDEATINRAKLFLYKAIAENRLDNIRRILDAQFPIEEEVGPGGLNLLMHCAQFGSVDCLTLLIQYGANVNSRDRNMRTALHYACASGRQEMVTALLAIPGINYEARTVGGETPLICAIESGNKRTVAVCLNRGFNPFSFTNFLMTPLDFAKKFLSVDGQDF